MIEPCFGISFERDIYATYFNESTPRVYEDAEGFNLEYIVKREPKIYLIQLQNYTSYEDANNIYHNECGRVLYTPYWYITPVLTGTGWYEEIVEVLDDDDPFYNRYEVNESRPLALKIYTDQNTAVGNYTFVVEARVENINLSYIVYKPYFNIIIWPCETINANSTQSMGVQALYWATANQQIRWAQFDQYPLCDYPWNYQVFLKEARSLESTIEVVPTLSGLQTMP